MEGAAGVSAWAETYAARALGYALTAHPEFFKHVAEVRNGQDPSVVARPYVVRDQGRRVELVAAYLQAGATADLAPGLSQPESLYLKWANSPEGQQVFAQRRRKAKCEWLRDTHHGYVKTAVWNLAPVVWCPDGHAPPVPAPQRALRYDAAETILFGALRVARRGAGRCLEPYCLKVKEVVRSGRSEVWWTGALLLSEGDYCDSCSERWERRPREGYPAEKALFDAAVPIVLSDADSRPRARRARRSPRVEDAPAVVSRTDVDPGEPTPSPAIAPEDRAEFERLMALAPDPDAHHRIERRLSSGR